MTCHCPHTPRWHGPRGCCVSGCECRATEMQIVSARRHTSECTVSADVSSGYGFAVCDGTHATVPSHRDRYTGAWFAPPDEPNRDGSPIPVDDALTCDGADCTRLPGHDGDHRPARRTSA